MNAWKQMPPIVEDQRTEESHMPEKTEHKIDLLKINVILPAVIILENGYTI